MAEINEELSIEEAFELLDKTIAVLEDGDISLEKSFEAYKSGMDLVKSVSEKIDAVEKRVAAINSDGEINEFQ